MPLGKPRGVGGVSSILALDVVSLTGSSAFDPGAILERLPSTPGGLRRARAFGRILPALRDFDGGAAYANRTGRKRRSAGWPRIDGCRPKRTAGSPFLGPADRFHMHSRRGRGREGGQAADGRFIAGEGAPGCFDWRWRSATATPGDFAGRARRVRA